jgi:hypothetical protein
MASPAVMYVAVAQASLSGLRPPLPREDPAERLIVMAKTILSSAARLMGANFSSRILAEKFARSLRVW